MKKNKKINARTDFFVPMIFLLLLFLFLIRSSYQPCEEVRTNINASILLRKKWRLSDLPVSRSIFVAEPEWIPCLLTPSSVHAQGSCSFLISSVVHHCCIKGCGRCELVLRARGRTVLGRKTLYRGHCVEDWDSCGSGYGWWLIARGGHILLPSSVTFPEPLLSRL